MKLPTRQLLMIDRWFYPLNRLVRGRGFPSSRKKQTGRVAMIKLMGLGSIIRLLSLCREREVNFSLVLLITFESNREACHLLGVGNCLFIRTTNAFHFVSDCAKIFFTLRQTRPDLIIDFERCSNAVSLFRQCLAFASGSSTLSFDDLDPIQSPPHEVRDINRFSFHEMLLEGIDRMPVDKKYVSPEVHRVKESTKIVVNVNCSEYLLARRYPRQLFREVLEGLSRSDHLTYYLTGAASEREYVQVLVSELSQSGMHVHNVAGEWTLAQLEQELRTSGLFISGDSGPLHLAIHLGVPTLAIWGPTRPRHFGYTDSEFLANVALDFPCAPCFVHPRSMHSVACKGQINCLRDLAPDLVIRSAEKLLLRSSAINYLTPAASW